MHRIFGESLHPYKVVKLPDSAYNYALLGILIPLCCSMCGLAATKMSLLQYFRLLLDYRYILIYPNERTMACALKQTNYFVVVLPSRQIKRVVRLTACNYEV